jgi:hypothetical protein
VGSIIQRTQQSFGTDIALTDLFTCTVELAGAAFGTRDTRMMIEGFIATMAEAAENDLP